MTGKSASRVVRKITLFGVHRQGKILKYVDIKKGQQFLYINCENWYTGYLHHEKSIETWCQAEKLFLTTENDVCIQYNYQHKYLH